MDLICLGINHKTCPVDIREKLAFSEERQPEALSSLKSLDGVRECFLLSTCNRVELYVHGHLEVVPKLAGFLETFHGFSQAHFLPYLYQFQGSAVVEHLFRVASGLDSLVVGENEIFGQVRNAFRLAQRLNALDSMLYQVAERAIRVGKKVRAETKISDRAVSVSSIAVDLARKIFGDNSNQRVLVLGTGKMSEQTVKRLVASGVGAVTVASRTYERALELAQKFGATPIHFNEWPEALLKSDIVISSTASPEPIVRAEEVALVMHSRRHKPLCFIDIAVPRDIDSRVGELDDVYLYDIDDLRVVSEENLKLRKKEIETCEALVQNELNSFDQWYRYTEAKPSIQKFMTYFERVVEDELAKARHQFKGKEKELNVLLGRVRARLLHLPLEQLKQAAKEGHLKNHINTLEALFPVDESTKSATSDLISNPLNPSHPNQAGAEFTKSTNL